MHISPLHSEFAAEITGMDLSAEITEEAFQKIDSAVNDYSLLLFRNQRMDDQSHLGFTRMFGALEEEHVSYYSRGEITYIGVVGNIDAEGNKQPNANRRVNSQKGNQMWHSDSSFREVPALHSILVAYEVPDEGGDTEFVSARAAYQRLDDETKKKIEDLVGIHDYIFSRTKISEDAVTDGQRAYMYPVRQRLVRTNPVTKEKNFYVGSHVRDIEHWPNETARPLIDGLIAEATRPASVYRHKWKEGDLMIWDNRCVLHRGCGYDADKYRRRMHQTRVRGLCPTLAE